MGLDILKKRSYSEEQHKFIKLCLAHHKTKLEGDYVSGNKIMKRKLDFIKDLMNDKRLNILKPLLKHKEPSIRYASATYFLMEEEKTALLALEKLEKENHKSVSFSAKITISEWKSGNLTFKHLKN